jgi:hypothetical protein
VAEYGDHPQAVPAVFKTQRQRLMLSRGEDRRLIQVKLAEGLHISMLRVACDIQSHLGKPGKGASHGRRDPWKQTKQK